MLKKLTALLFACALGLAFVSTAAFADAAKGQKLYLKFLKGSCGMDGGTMATKHTQAEWKAIQDEGKLVEKLQEYCPNSKPLKDNFVPDVYDFLHNYASDSGNVPSC
ncbi:MAG: cytochrome C [Sulfurospirillaceae bacterium]|jgi:uncharacterized protein (DUF1501 family)|nr:cytochrome C [Sulfurospirillaceae bacterium]MDY0238074.1 cytochrome C [Campylobacterales bacterium]